MRGMVLLRTSRWFIVDNAYLPVHVMPHRRGTTVVQVWHAVGALKRFGWDSLQPLTEPERRFLHRHYDWVVCSAERVARAVGGGLPDAAGAGPAARARHGSMRSPTRRPWRRRGPGCWRGHPMLAGRRVVLYAPTFRGRGAAKHAAPGIDAAGAAGRPAAGPPARPQDPPEPGPGRDPDRRVRPRRRSAADDLNDLLAASDVLITDYSSSIFEWALLRRPLVLVVPDLEAYERDPGLYLDYRDGDDRDPGRGHRAAVARPSLESTVDDAAWDAFIAEHLGAADGRASERFVETLPGFGPGPGGSARPRPRGATEARWYPSARCPPRAKRRLRTGTRPATRAPSASSARRIDDVRSRRRLVRYLVAADMHKRGADTLLGNFWWVLDPLLQMVVYVVLVTLIARGHGHPGLPAVHLRGDPALEVVHRLGDRRDDLGDQPGPADQADPVPQDRPAGRGDDGRRRRLRVRASSRCSG